MTRINRPSCGAGESSWGNIPRINLDAPLISGPSLVLVLLTPLFECRPRVYNRLAAPVLPSVYLLGGPLSWYLDRMHSLRRPPSTRGTHSRASSVSTSPSTLGHRELRLTCIATICVTLAQRRVCSPPPSPLRWLLWPPLAALVLRQPVARPAI